MCAAGTAHTLCSHCSHRQAQGGSESGPSRWSCSFSTRLTSDVDGPYLNSAPSLPVSLGRFPRMECFDAGAWQTIFGRTGANFSPDAFDWQLSTASIKLDPERFIHFEAWVELDTPSQAQSLNESSSKLKQSNEPPRPPVYVTIRSRTSMIANTWSVLSFFQESMCKSHETRLLRLFLL